MIVIYFSSEPKSVPKDKTVSLKDIDFGLDQQSQHSDSSENSSDNDSDDETFNLNQNEYNDYKEMADEEANALDELQSILAKTRKRLTVTEQTGIEKLIKVKQEETETSTVEQGVTFDALNPLYEENNDQMYLDTMSEFCKNLGVPTNEENDQVLRAEDKDEEEEVEEMKEESSTEPKTSHRKRADTDSEDEILKEHEVEAASNQDKSKDEDEFELLEDEPTLDRGLASFLNLCKNKGFIEAEKSKRSARPKKENLEAINYTIEEKNYYDIDDKYNRGRDRFSGPTGDFHEKANYKPNVKLDYIDEKGHSMNEKEAFRYLSHKFHGKGSGKKKTEKQQNKYKEKDVMAKMSSVDTPLNTVKMLVEKQKRLQQPYVLLSATKNKQEE